MFDETSAKAMAKQAANLSGKRQNLYRSGNGWLYGIDGTLDILRKQFNDKKPYQFIGHVYPDGQEPKEDK